ncbi:hypothetical protein BAPKO_0651 [Borreliella afzelii PKo]|nr:hypothetical protein BAPKO_0651 [Borreliella afzelii PKo]
MLKIIWGKIFQRVKKKVNKKSGFNWPLFVVLIIQK